MAPRPYTAAELFDRIRNGDPDLVILDVRNEDDFKRFKVEGPKPAAMINIPYIDFSDDEEAESVARVPRGKKIHIVCAKENSAKFVGDVLTGHGFDDVGYLAGGINTWGNLLVPFPVWEGDDFRLYQFIRPGKASCSYGLISGQEMMVFDPTRQTDTYLEFAERAGARITAAFETHLQADYISGSPRIAELTGATINAGSGDFQGAAFAYSPVSDGQDFPFRDKGPAVKALHTPGHTPGSTSYLIDGRFLISGDTLFILSIGRPDLGGKVDEWAGLLFHTLTSRVAPLDGTLTVLPGHFMGWEEANPDLVFMDTLASVRHRNKAIFDMTERDRFIAFIRENMRPQPEVYARIRQVNAGHLTVDENEANVMDLGKNECAASQGK